MYSCSPTQNFNVFLELVNHNFKLFFHWNIYFTIVKNCVQDSLEIKLRLLDCIF